MGEGIVVEPGERAVGLLAALNAEYRRLQPGLGITEERIRGLRTSMT